MNDIVLGGTAYKPRVVRVPSKVGKFSSVTAVNEEQFRRSIFSVLRTLFFAYPR